ncbi:MAG: ATP synthase F0 subunit B [Bacteroidetes bacterium GWE2_41_25]|nr:MAG: ATP synthase F0 subunit B [Bacteroidetes bacterium GWA2_40_15]OFX87944.1 MAG: ATP synthase F0 subunit B [Bacteroidetes bacterium GWC2_40_22]OFX96416.1 MAG: ATP synthase F0 subunit B [Bacteroidetes bacterium GWE2_41_25]OFY58723.1 MAG: ATP synthase F0 subunit B [Bacteroidetes bacterium GWF2_41_9]HAM08846.1 ATP synthase F0 subunit B [Bacteroidales bacterium]
MILLANSLTSPAIGLVFWSVLIFGLFFFLLSKFAWKPILNAVKARDEMIKGSLEAAEIAREDMMRLQSDNEAILRKAREEREVILKDARDVRDKLIAEAKGKASEEAEKIVEKARIGIEGEKRKALAEIHDQVAILSVDIASKLLGEQLKKTGEQEKLIDNYLKEINFNKN